MKITWRYLPNMMTGLRLVLVLPILYTIWVGYYSMAFYLFLIAAVTDAVDGRLARYYDWTSQLGAFLDPLADKCLLVSTFLLLGYLAQLPWWVVSVGIGRDVFIVAGIFIYRTWIGPIFYESILMSKINTVVQLWVILLILFHLGFHNIPDNFLYAINSIMVITSIMSFIQYAWLWGKRAWQHVNQKG